LCRSEGSPCVAWPASRSLVNSPLSENSASAPAVLITGASGLVGSALVRAAILRRWIVIPVGFRSPAQAVGCQTYQMDLTRPENLGILFERHRPSLVINSAAIISEAQCRSDESHARLVNVELPRRLAEMTADAGGKFIHISTEAVYGPLGSRPHVESDSTAPSGVYAGTKAAADAAVLAANPAALVVRATPVGFRPGAPGASLAEWIAAQAMAGAEVSGFQNVQFTPVSTDQLASFLLSEALHRLSGAINFCSSAPLSKYEFARALVAGLGLDPSLVKPSCREPADSVHQGAMHTLRSAEHGVPLPLPTGVIASLVSQWGEFHHGDASGNGRGSLSVAPSPGTLLSTGGDSSNPSAQSGCIQ